MSIIAVFPRCFLRRCKHPGKEGVKIKTRSFAIRLPTDHWIWEQPDRRRVVEEALKQYKSLSPEMAQIRKTLAEINSQLVKYRDLSAVPVEADRQEFNQQGGEEKTLPKTGEIDPAKFLNAIASAFEF